ncbi:MAG: hypothetical protein NZ841_02175 [Dictyoglomus sp.]|nr:hypothetical protein [Dictyoglomus sp.]MCX7941803.1 hypothetical protein [Dictyoglomaceae bacterium]MDW8188094.1 hypothetical protein [Dictyoglomus sp.]
MKEEGQLILVISIVLFLFILGGIILSLIPPENLMTRRQIESNQAFYLSQAGLENAVYLINNNVNLKDLNLTSKKESYGLNVSYTITETSGLRFTGSFILPIRLGEYVVSANYTNALINEGGLLVQGDFFVIRSVGYIPSISNYTVKRSIEIWGRADQFSLDPFKYAVFAARNVSVKGNAIIRGEPLPGGRFDTAIYSRGDVDLIGRSYDINGTNSPIPGIDYIANDPSLQMPTLNFSYLRAISMMQGLYRSGNRVDLKNVVNVAQSNPSWYNSATKTYNTWSLVIFVDGSADMAGNVEFQGIIVVRGNLKITGTGNKVRGIVFASNMDTSTDELSIYGDPVIDGCSLGEDVDIGGNSTVRHNNEFLNNIFSTHRIENVVQKTRTKLRTLSWREY